MLELLDHNADGPNDMSLSDTLHRLISGGTGGIGLSLWSLVVAFVLLYFGNLYIRKRRQYLVSHQSRGYML